MKNFKNIRSEVFGKELDKEPTTDEVVSAIMAMFGALCFVEGEEFSAFPQLVQEALKKFNTPTLRTSLMYRLYRPEWYAEMS